MTILFRDLLTFSTCCSSNEIFSKYKKEEMKIIDENYLPLQRGFFVKFHIKALFVYSSKIYCQCF